MVASCVTAVQSFRQDYIACLIGGNRRILRSQDDKFRASLVFLVPSNFAKIYGMETCSGFGVVTFRLNYMCLHANNAKKISPFALLTTPPLLLFLISSSSYASSSTNMGIMLKTVVISHFLHLYFLLLLFFILFPTFLRFLLLLLLLFS